MEEIRDRLKAVIIKALRSDKKPADLEGTDLIEELHVSSIDMLEILINIEIAFQIRVADDDLKVELVSSLDRLEQYIRDQRSRA
jgi:acyl carrier protein